MNAITRRSEPLFREIIHALLKEAFSDWKPMCHASTHSYLGVHISKNGLSMGVNAVMQDQWMGNITKNNSGNTHYIFSGIITDSYEEAIEELKEYVRTNNL